MAKIVAVIIICFAIKIILDNRRFDVENVDISNRWISVRIERVAMKMVQNDYYRKRKSIRTQKGTFRVDYMKDVAKKRSELQRKICIGNSFNEDFCNFVKESYANIKVRQLQSAIIEFEKHKKEVIHQNLRNFTNDTDVITPEKFFEIKSLQKGDIVGVYIIHNTAIDKYYVGQAKRLFFRVNQHFTGHGNGDVYADYKHGDSFTIKIIKLSSSGYDDLDLLEKDMIKKYDAYYSGYNRTVGNSK